MTWEKTYQILLIIFILGAGMRLYGLGNNSFVADEFIDINSSYGYAKTAQWKAWDFNYEKPASMNANDARDERAYAYKWQVSEALRFLSPTERSARLISVIWGLFSIVLMFWTGWFYTRKKTIGLLAAFLFAVSISGITFDRHLRMYAMFFPVFLAFATSLFALFESKYNGKWPMGKRIWEQFGVNIAYLIPFGVLGILSFHVHALSANIVPLFGVYLAWMTFALRKEKRGYRNKYAMTLGAGLLALVGALAVSHLAREMIFGGALTWFENHYSYPGYWLGDFAHPLLGVLVLAWGSYFLGKKMNRQKEAVWLTSGALVPLVMAIWLWNRNAGPQYIFFAQSFVILLTATGVYGLSVFVREHLTTFDKRSIWAGIFGLSLLLLPNYGYFFEENNTYHETSTGDSPNYRKVFDFFKKNMQPDDVLITRNFRNYYFSGAKVPVYDFGGELSKEKFSLADLQAIMTEHPHGWVIVSDNDYDYIGNDAEQFWKKNMERVSNSSVRGAIEVYRWGYK